MHIPPNHIRVWAFEDAPEELACLSQNGGDEDWLALVPPKFNGNTPNWLDYGPFGVCSIHRYEHPELPGYLVFIGCHA